MKTIIATDTWTLWKCLSCRFVFKTGLKTHYETLPAEQYTIYNFDRSKEVEELVKTIRKYFPHFTQTTLLEIGCGTGILLSELQKFGFIVYGSEPSSVAVQIARDKFKLLNVRNEYFTGNPVGVSPNVFLLYDVLEHLDNEHELFTTVSREMGTESIFVVRSGNPASFNARLFPAKWMYFLLDQHISFHTQQSLEVLCRKTGLRLVRFLPFRHPYGGLSLKTLIENIIKAVAFTFVPATSSIRKNHRIAMTHDHFIAVMQTNRQ